MSGPRIDEDGDGQAPGYPWDADPDDLISQDASPDDVEAWIEKMERERYG